MAKYTKNLNLEKPDYDEYYDIGTFNANADKIDKGIEDSENRSTQRLDAHKQSNDHTADKIRYDGKIPKDNVKDALDETDTRIDNIVSQGGSDNTEVVDARHSTTKDKTYDTLKGRLEDGEQDIEKLKTDTNVAESVTETSYENVINVPDSATNGQVSGVVRGETLTNYYNHDNLRFKNDDVLSEKLETGFKLVKQSSSTRYAYDTLTNLKAGTYTLVCYVKENTTVTYNALEVRYQDSSIVYLQIFKRGYVGYYKQAFTFNKDVQQINFYIQKNEEDGVGYTLENILFLEGDWTNKEVPASYITGTKSTIGSARVKSVGKNVWDGEYDVGVMITFDGDLGPSGTAKTTKRIPCQPNTTYTVLDDFGDRHRWRFEDRNGNKIGAADSRTITTPNNAKYMYLYFGTSNYSVPEERAILIGGSGLLYEPYKESTAYVVAKKDNKIVNLKSLPNGVADEISLSEKKAIIKIGTKTDVVSGTVINYTDMADGGQFVAYYEDGTQQAGVKGDTLTATATSLIYQLAEPEIIPVRWTGLQAYEGGTIYVDTIIPELGFYYDNGLESHYPDHPIKEVDTLYRVDKETGYREPLDVSKCEIREDRLSFTHPDLVDGDLCDWDYVPMTESTRPETTFEFPTNLKASVNSLLDADQINKKEHNIFKTRLDNHDGDIERIDTDVERIDTDIENAQTAIDATQSDIDTHKQDSNNPHNVTPEQIGAETPSGAQAKVDVVASDFVSHKAETITDDVHGLYTHLGDLRIINFTLYSNSSVKLKFSENTFICLLLMQGRQSNAYGAFVLQGYGIGGTRYKVGEIQKGSAISISVDEEGESSFTVSNASNVTVSCHLVMIGGSPPEII